jgi:hypothetical protein
MVYVERNYYEWKKEKGEHRKPLATCVRCNNQVQYVLCSDGDGIGFPGIWTFKYNKTYAFVCPICPHHEIISKELARAIIKGD